MVSLSERNDDDRVLKIITMCPSQGFTDNHSVPINYHVVSFMEAWQGRLYYSFMTCYLLQKSNHGPSSIEDDGFSLTFMGRTTVSYESYDVLRLFYN